MSPAVCSILEVRVFHNPIVAAFAMFNQIVHLCMYGFPAAVQHQIIELKTSQQRGD